MDGVADSHLGRSARPAEFIGPGRSPLEQVGQRLGHVGRGPVVKCNVPKAGLGQRHRWLPERRGICIGCTMPGFPDKFMPFMTRPGVARFPRGVGVLYGRSSATVGTFTGRTVDKTKVATSRHETDDRSDPHLVVRPSGLLARPF